MYLTKLPLEDSTERAMSLEVYSNCHLCVYVCLNMCSLEVLLGGCQRGPLMLPWAPGTKQMGRNNTYHHISL